MFIILGVTPLAEHMQASTPTYANLGLYSKSHHKTSKLRILHWCPRDPGIDFNGIFIFFNSVCYVFPVFSSCPVSFCACRELSCDSFAFVLATLHSLFL